MPSGGKPLEWIKPLNPEGNLNSDFQGCYRGHFSNWNVKLKPGLVPRYVNPRRVNLRRQQGWRIASPEDAQMGETFSLDAPSPMDSAQRAGNLVLMVAPLDVVARSQAIKIEQSRSYLSAETNNYLATRPGEETYSREGAPIRFKERDHGVQQIIR